MGIFGWRLTNKKPHIESQEVKDLHKKLEAEQKHRQEQLIISENKEAELKLQIEQSEFEHKQRIDKQQNSRKKRAVAHLKQAERYYNQMIQCKGARKSELKAIVDTRLESAENLGYKVKGTITETINGLI